jgi:hypothetical protein
VISNQRPIMEAQDSSRRVAKTQGAGVLIKKEGLWHDEEIASIPSIP